MKLESSVPEKSLTQNSRSDGPCCGGSGESHCCEELGSNEPWWKIQQQPIIAGLCNPILRTFLSLELSDTKQPKTKSAAPEETKVEWQWCPQLHCHNKKQTLGMFCIFGSEVARPKQLCQIWGYCASVCLRFQKIHMYFNNIPADCTRWWNRLDKLYLR